MDPAPFVIAAILVIAAIAIGYAVSQGHKRQAAWSQLAEQLGLQHEGSVLLGEHDGVPIRIAMEMRRELRGLVQTCVVRAEVPGSLPAGFVAAPRAWTSGLDRLLADNVVTPDDPALKECFVFQSDRPQECEALISEPEAQKALLELFSPRRVGFVEKNRVHVSYRGELMDSEEARRALKDVVQAARTLAAVQARIEPAPEALRGD